MIHIAYIKMVNQGAKMSNCYAASVIVGMSKINIKARLAESINLQ